MPNMLLILDDTTSMTATTGVGDGDLDGDGLNDARLDVAYRVLYQILNRDSFHGHDFRDQLSVPDATIPRSSGREQRNTTILYNQNVTTSGDGRMP